MLVPTYTMLGHGPVVLMLHGAGGGFRSFAPQVETLASLGFRAVAWNMPGYGPSPPIEPYSFKGLAEGAVALIESLAPVTDGAPGPTRRGSSVSAISLIGRPSASQASRSAGSGSCLQKKPPFAPTGTITVFFTICAFMRPSTSVR